ncbi:uncharacterized protein VTP21DRAFT_5406 [Calcarisporiella thermophila]|uniref:uncharacterized protein n=1 Tax=Calcarisporiella thermophila TaxID=911321 RepID=UPI0037420E09
MGRDRNRKQKESHYPAPSMLEEEAIKYFTELESRMTAVDFEDAEEKEIFFSNVFEEVARYDEAEVAKEHRCSVVLEKLLRLSDPFQLRVFFDRLNGRFMEVFTHTYASHVCQTLLELIAEVVEKEVKGEIDSREEHKEEGGEDMGVLLSASDLVINMCEQIQPNIYDLMKDVYGSHILRVILYVLAGRRVEESSVRSKKSTQFRQKHDNTSRKHEPSSRRLTSPKFTNYLIHWLKTIPATIGADEMRLLALDSHSARVIQELLELEAERGLSETSESVMDCILVGMISDGKESDKANSQRNHYFQNMIENEAGTHVAETIIKVAPGWVYNKIYTLFFRNRFRKISKHELTNFVLQKLLVNARSVPQFEMMVAETTEIFPFLLWKNRQGVVRALIEGSTRVKACYKEILDALWNAFQVRSKDERVYIVDLILLMMICPDYEAIKKNEQEKAKIHASKFSIQGSLIVQLVLTWPVEYNKYFVDSIISLEQNRLVAMSYFAPGARVLEALMTSPTVEVHSKKKIIHRFTSKFVAMAIHKEASHVLDKFWAAADLQTKEKIAKDLVNSEQKIAQSPWGRIVLRNCKIENFKRRHDEWAEKQTGVERKRELFKDIFEDEAFTSTEKSKKQKTSQKEAKMNEKEKPEESKSEEEYDEESEEESEKESEKESDEESEEESEEESDEESDEESEEESEEEPEEEPEESQSSIKSKGREEISKSKRKMQEAAAGQSKSKKCKK